MQDIPDKFPYYKPKYTIGNNLSSSIGLFNALTKGQSINAVRHQISKAITLLQNTAIVLVKPYRVVQGAWTFRAWS